ncbi:hypothetical protein ACIA49_01295 [Kribbella sp. NPDC051587]|uniref:hypothetical protein n=1 Tax=Kribbella sp. NPDC051587 TaxID=3364119 RepID=UPI0037A3A79D
MSINDLWQEIEPLLTPAIAAALRPPASIDSLHAWVDVAGALPEPLVALYSQHEGTYHAGGSKGFCFIGSWYPLPVDDAIQQYQRAKGLTDLYGQTALIPFAVGVDGSLLAVASEATQAVDIIYTDGPGGECFPSLETLMRRTVTGLQGQDSEYRPELSNNHLIWFNRKYEAGDSA